MSTPLAEYRFPVAFARRRALGASFLVWAVAWAGGPAGARAAEASNLPHLGDAPVAPNAEAVEFLPVAGTRAPLSGYSVTITNREEVRTFYRTVYLASENTDLYWTGNAATCNAGTTDPGFRDEVARRINYFRAMAGLPADITLEAALHPKAQQAALMMSVNNALSHFPPPGWVCYTADGAAAAGNSNLSLGSAGPDAIDGYMEDHGPGNGAVGHRRWLLYPQTQVMGTGDVDAGGNRLAANATWVFDGNYGGPRPATRDGFVSWPPPGFVPYPVVWARWSFSYPDGNFAGATVTMSTNGVPIPVVLETVATGVGENSVVWRPGGLSASAPYLWPRPAADTTYQVSVNNVLVSGSPEDFNYSVMIFDPSDPVPPAIPTELVAVVTAADTIELRWRDNADNEDSYIVKQGFGPVPPYDVLTTLGQNGKSLLITADPASWFYKVRAGNASGLSRLSNKASATLLPNPQPAVPPSAPGGLFVSGVKFKTNHVITLAWTDTSSNENGFKIWRSPNGVTFKLVGTIAADRPWFTDKRLDPCTTYHYRVQAYNVAGDSLPSNTVSTNTLCIAAP